MAIGRLADPDRDPAVPGARGWRGAGPDAARLFPAPETSNVVILTYAFSKGELVFDPTLPITDATGTIHTPVVSVYHAFGLFGRSANVTGSLPFAIGDLSGNVAR